MANCDSRPKEESMQYNQSSADNTQKLRSEPDSNFTRDILLLGKTGLGKTSTALKLLQWDKDESKIISLNLDGTKKTQEMPKPSHGGGLTHRTSDIQAWHNLATNIRVVDVPGFADTIRHPFLDLWRKNLYTVYRISKLTKVFRFCRVLYFLPNRGVPERVDGYLKEELQLICKFFGNLVFKVMVVVCTNNPDPKYQCSKFDSNDKAAIKDMMNCVIKEITKCNDNELEIVYIAYKDDDSQAIKDVMAAFQGKMDHKLDLDANACIRCIENDVSIYEQPVAVTNSFYTSAAAVAAAAVAAAASKFKIISKRNPLPDKTMCHPKFRNKVSHQSHADLHAEQMSEDDRRFYEFYCQTVCTTCNQPPGTKGCTIMCSSNEKHSIDIPSVQQTGQTNTE